MSVQSFRVLTVLTAVAGSGILMMAFLLLVKLHRQSKRNMVSAEAPKRAPEQQKQTPLPPSPEVRSQATVITQPMNARGRVLLAEDVPFNRTLIGAFLSKLDVQFVATENGAQAVEQAQRESFAAILMDIQMPVMDGITATKMLRAAGFHRPIVALTGNATAEDVALYLQSGCTHCLSKPIDFDGLAKLLAEILRQETRGESAFSYTDDSTGLQAIKHAFETSLPDRLAHLHACVTESNWDEVKHLAHALKGSAGSFGYPRVTDIARDLERAAQQGDASQALKTMGQLSMLDEVQQLQRHQQHSSNESILSAKVQQ